MLQKYFALLLSKNDFCILRDEKESHISLFAAQ